MSIEENKALVRDHYEILNRKEIDTSYQHIDPKCIFHMPDGDLTVEKGKEFDKAFFAAFPDISFAVEDMIAEGDKVAFRVTLRGTNTGELMGNAPTGKKIEITNSNVFKIVAGKFVEFWATTDRLRLMQQLGVIPKQ